ncbi:pimeloyl-ACP methyl ester carboxylesterase/DNA-binding CsgD family transcriptional regulator [Rubricella aquisinus]|uniref:Pimeloyl-ACP methyl ester carboxylesterase/DNA-binding CsgD family transcriptional regulator n=1 Tax=Rubricella aquisinus TaxID=2028108 RepID=A0A840X0I1_9RHOB|nr:alpha/beta fold hydrolase [Rubricella aquisinus]MBB5516234.1 pimeloyl-ACP methyl ester carboxylesterase/DNA-binding CsgD family transcriptional regulator [Rubricella aquisinus]
METPAENSKLIALLNSAYAVSEDSTQLDALFDQANAYLFQSGGGWQRAPDLGAARVLAPEIAQHSARLARLFDRFQGSESAQNALSGSMAETAHARMIVSAAGRVEWCNAAAAALFPEAQGKPLDAVPITRDGQQALRLALRGLRDGSGLTQDILPVVHDADGSLHFAVCQVTALPDRPEEPVLALAFSHIRWTDDLVDQIAAALGLSKREAVVLHGVLNGQNQSQIAQTAGKSVETIKAQSKAILQKTGLPRMADVAVLASSVAYLRRPAVAAQNLPEDGHFLPVAGGRTVHYRQYGAPDGVPFLFLHGLQTGPFFPKAMERAFAREGLRLIAPSRPWFGKTSPSSTDAAFNDETITDALAVLEAEQIEHVHIIAHQGGVSHAYRIAAHLGDRLRGMVMIGAGIPIDETTHIHAMNRQTRMAAIATKHTPALMEMILTIGTRAFLKSGPRSFFDSFFRNDPVDRACLDDPAIYPAIEAGGLHMIVQGTRGFVLDGAAAMSDWTEAYRAVHCRAEWLHGAHCPVMGAEFIEQYVRTTSNNPVTIVPDSGFHVLYHKPDLILDLLRRAAAWDEAR